MSNYRKKQQMRVANSVFCLKITNRQMNSSAARCPSLREDGLSLARERPEVSAHSSPSLPLLWQEVKEGMSLSSDGLEVTSVPRHTK